ncbi:MAG: A24 family peptidase [Pseudomonadota bacterium]
MDWLFALVAALASGAVGYAITWARVDLDLRPRETALWSTAIGGVGALVWTLAPPGGSALILFAAMGPLVWIDWKRKILPDGITLPLIIAGVVFAVGEDRLIDAVLGATLGYLSFRALGWAWERLRGVDALGRGDAKLFAAIGAFLGWAALPEVAFIAAVLGIGFGVIRRSISGDEEIPFGPALAISAAAVWTAGPLLPV